MCLIIFVTCLMVVPYQTKGDEHNIHATEDARKADEDASASNSSYYSTREMRDMVLKEWAGKTQEVQEYFDQIPSEEFKETSDTLKLMHYYEKKGLKDIDTRQVYNITPHVREPPGLQYTVEVNDTYVPKYRISSSEEIRMEKYGTFNSKPDDDSSEENEEGVSEASVTTEPPDSDGEKPGGKKKPKNWPTNMDPKEKVRRKKKRRPLKDESKKKEMIKKNINFQKSINLKVNKNGFENEYLHRPHNNYQLGVLGINKKFNKIAYEEAYRRNIKDVMYRKFVHSNFKKGSSPDGRFKEKAKLKSNMYRQNHVSLFDLFEKSTKLKHKRKDLSQHSHRNMSRSRQRSWSNNHYPQHLF